MNCKLYVVHNMEPYVPRFLILLLCVVAVLATPSCDGGMQPSDSVVNKIVHPVITDTMAVIKGTLHFVGTSPSADSMRDLRVVAFGRKYPLDSIAAALMAGQAFYNRATIPATSDTASYSLTLPARRYEYIAVAHQWGPGLLSDWRAVGVYAPTGDVTQPGIVVLHPRDTVRVDITVDWDHLPPE
jgi:hypothetical protein